MDEVHVEERIAASPAVVYAMVSDVTQMGSWSPETTSCRWLGGASGAAVGARFKGTNKDRWRRWSTVCTVVAAEPGRRFAFDVEFLSRLAISRWSYEFLPDGGGCRVVESWADRRAGWMVRASPLVMGVADRASHNRAGMQATLARLKEAAEGPGPGPAASALGERGSS